MPQRAPSFRAARVGLRAVHGRGPEAAIGGDTAGIDPVAFRLAFQFDKPDIFLGRGIEEADFQIARHQDLAARQGNDAGLHRQVVAAGIAGPRIVAVQLGALGIDPPEQAFGGAPDGALAEQAACRGDALGLVRTHPVSHKP